jgi:photosystem II stability/assembly factor-like uncharacterized protein
MTDRHSLDERLHRHFAVGNDPMPSAGLEERIIHHVFARAPRHKVSLPMQILAAAALAALAIGIGVAVRQSHVPTPIHTVSPSPVPSGTPSAGTALTSHFMSIRMVSQQIGWATSDRGILRTTDGGVEWRNVTPAWVPHQPVGQGYAFLDAPRAWLAVSVKQGTSDTDVVAVARTSDGGNTWQRSQPIHLRWVGYPYQLSFLDATHGWLLAANGPAAGSGAVNIFATLDGGVSWTETSYGDYQGSTPRALPFGCDKAGLAFIDSRTGWASGSCNGPGAFFFVTHDGGRTWNQQPLANPGNRLGQGQGLAVPIILSPTAAILPAEAFVGGPDGTPVYFTTDGGNTWPLQKAPSLPVKDSLEIFFALDIDHWWVFARNGSSLERTADGGKHWYQDRTNLPPADGLTVDFVTAQVGYAGGVFQPQDGSTQVRPLVVRLYKTLDGGSTWQSVPAHVIAR